MNEFGAPFRGVAELGRQKRIDAPPASVARLQDGNSLARAAEFAGGHQPCGACADDDDVVRTRSGHPNVIEPLRLMRQRFEFGSAGASLHPLAPGCSPVSSL